MTLDLKSYRRDCLLGTLGALLMLRERSALHLDGSKRRLGGEAAENRGGKMTWMKK